MPLLITLLLSFFVFCYGDAYTNTVTQKVVQSKDSSALTLNEETQKQIRKLGKKYRQFAKELQQRSVNILSRLLQQEKKILHSVNSQTSLLTDGIYNAFARAVDGTGVSIGLVQFNNYLPSLDSLSTTVAFLRLSGSDQLDELSKVSQQLQAEWNRTQLVQAFITDRYRQMQTSTMNISLLKSMRKIQNDIGYYQLQITKYKQLLKNPDALFAAVLELAKRQKGFAAFMSSNSQLAGLFGVSGNGSGVPLAGLQTIADTQQQLTQQIAGNGIGNPSLFLTEQLNKGDQLVQVLQNKVNQLGGGDPMMMPDFKPNMQRTKKFMERWVWGVNLQSQRPNGWLPTTTDLGLMVGYQFTDKIITGGGLAYKMGWGKSISNIRFSHEGVGLRLFTDIKLKGSIWISGGYEWNHQAAFSRIRDLSTLSSWQRSGLIGLSKKYNIGKKKGSIQLLWDFLSYQQMPQGRALKFRVGYGL